MRQAIERRQCMLRSAALALLWGVGSAAAQQAAFDGTGLQFQPPSRPAFSIADVQPLPSLASPYPGRNLGIRWRPPGGHGVDITAWRRFEGPAPDAISLIQNREPVYGARVEMKLRSARSGFAAELKAIGLQLDNGAKIMLRRKNGNPTLYYRQQF